mmetsp:Transcript_25903/g.81109  ORF Transcript_25903/g.81109 Transcript_25903/m.81109 type:complete len:511 (-) Transcript_25903:40-1572(-)
MATGPTLMSGLLSQRYRHSWHHKRAELQSTAELLLYNEHETFCSDAINVRGAEMKVRDGRVTLKLAQTKGHGSPARKKQHRYVFRFGEDQEYTAAWIDALERCIAPRDLQLPPIGFKNSIKKFRKRRARATRRNYSEHANFMDEKFPNPYRDEFTPAIAERTVTKSALTGERISNNNFTSGPPPPEPEKPPEVTPSGLILAAAVKGNVYKVMGELQKLHARVCAEQKEMPFADIVNRPCATGERILHTACQYGHEGMVETLLRAGAQPQEYDEAGEASALYYAAGKGHLAVVELLHEWGCNLDRGCADGTTPLSHACVNSHVEMCEYLLEHGANVGPYEVLMDKYGIEAFNRACSMGLKSLAKKIYKAASEQLRARMLEVRTLHGVTPLYSAALSGNLETVQWLLKQGADPNKRTAHGASPLHAACQRSVANVVRKMLEHGANPLIVSKSGQGALQLAQETLEQLRATEDISNFFIEEGEEIVQMLQEHLSWYDYTTLEIEDAYDPDLRD